MGRLGQGATVPVLASRLDLNPVGSNPFPKRRMFLMSWRTFAAFRPEGDVTVGSAKPMELSRRGFIKITGAGLAASSLGALGFGGAGEALAASVRPFKLTAATETRNTCTYCSVACGILIYSLGDRAKNAVSDIIHIEGDPDHPVNRGTLVRRGRRCSTLCTPRRV